MDTIDFQIIAIRPLQECNENISKCLQKEETYYFCNDYEINEDGCKINFTRSNIKPLSNAFFLYNKEKEEHNKEKKPSISISAIVGKNGDGKSSIIELMIRLINNFSHFYELNTQDYRLYKVEGVRASLYYKVNDEFFRLKEDSNGPSIYRIGKLLHKNEKIEIDTNYEEIERSCIQKEFFYTMVSNYSHYAYNIYDFTEEWDKNIKNKDDNEKCWLFRIFHKNDGYQTPLVLHPYRNKGNIDINKEKFLSNQRLLAHFINASNTNNSKISFRNINNQYAELLHLKDSGSSKLQDILIKEYFEEVNRKSILDKYIELLDEFLNINSSNDYSLELKQIEKEIINPLENIWNKTIVINKEIFDEILIWLFKNKKKPTLARSKTDISILLSKLKSINTILKNDTNNIYNLDICNKINNIVLNYSKSNIYLFNLLQIQRIDLIDNICDHWKQKRTTKNYAFKLESDIIIKSYDDLTWVEKSNHYIIYKTFNIFSKYPNYDNTCRIFNEEAIGFSDKYSLDRMKKQLNNNFRILLNDINITKSHITLKLRQTLNFKNKILQNEDMYTDIQEDTYSNENIKNNLIDSGLIGKELRLENRFTLSFNSLKRYYNTDFISLDLLPPPIFESQIFLRQTRGDNKYTLLSALSSGEKQMLNSLSAIMYHLQNINSTINGLIKYSYVNLILEEIELYFHPEYQRSFIKSLLELIYDTKLNSINGINIIFVTHSPFILSDIPKRNVLFLKEGQPIYKMQENTFGANIHSLLKNGFFLDTLPIGNFAQDKINCLFEKLNTGDFNEEEYKQLYQDIILIGEPYLRSQLLKLYNSYQLPRTEFNREKSYETQIAKLELYIRELDSKINKDYDKSKSQA